MRCLPLAPEHDCAVFGIFSTAVVGRKEVGPSWSIEQIQNELRSGRGLGLFVGGEAERLVAYVLYREQPAALEITHLATNPSDQGQGFMFALLTELVRRRAVGTELWLEVHAENRAAHKLYRKLGFRQVGRRANYYSDGAEALLFTLSAKP